MPGIFLGALFGPATAGFYLLAMRVLDGPLSVVSESVAKVLYARSRTAVVSRGFASLISRIAMGLLTIVFFPTIIIFFWGEPIFIIIFGYKWSEAGIYGGWLILGMAIQFVYTALSVVLLATEAQDINLYIHLCLLAAKVAAIWYGYSAGDPLAAIISLTFVNVVGYSAAIVVIMLHARRCNLKKLLVRLA